MARDVLTLQEQIAGLAKAIYKKRRRRTERFHAPLWTVLCTVYKVYDPALAGLLKQIRTLIREKLLHIHLKWIPEPSNPADKLLMEESRCEFWAQCALGKVEST
jgi:hypothetical protein